LEFFNDLAQNKYFNHSISFSRLIANFLLAGSLLIGYSHSSNADSLRSNNLKTNFKGLAKLSFDSNGRLLARIGKDGQVSLFDMTSGNKSAPHQKHSLIGLLVSSDGNKLVGVDTNSQVLVWDIEANQFQLQKPNQSNLIAKTRAFSSNGFLVASSDEEPWITLKELGSGQTVQIFYGHTVKQSRFSMDTQTLLMA